MLSLTDDIWVSDGCLEAITSLATKITNLLNENKVTNKRISVTLRIIA